MTQRGLTAIDHTWEAGAEEFARLSDRLAYYPPITERLIAMIPDVCDRVVDFGCGHGRLARRLIAQPARRSWQLILADTSRAMLDLTTDIGAPGVEVVRVHAGAELADALPAHLRGRVDTIACNSSFHLLRDAAGNPDPGPLLESARTLLRPGGALVANLPDQAYRFTDGWESQFYLHARSIWPDEGGRSSVTLFDAALIEQTAAKTGFDVEVTQATVTVPWETFLVFYSLSVLGGGRMPGRSPDERRRELRALRPRFETIDYRWAFVKFTVPDGEPRTP
jgi:SAM-dependent methyltransferase